MSATPDKEGVPEWAVKAADEIIRAIRDALKSRAPTTLNVAAIIARHAPGTQELCGLLEEYLAEQQGFADQIISPRSLKQEYLDRVTRIRTALDRAKGGV